MTTIKDAPLNGHDGKILYELYYRQGNNPHPQTVMFYFTPGDMKAVVDRSKRFCEVLNYRFVHVRPAIIDLDKEENVILNKDL